MSTLHMCAYTRSSHACSPGLMSSMSVGAVSSLAGAHTSKCARTVLSSSHPPTRYSPVSQPRDSPLSPLRRRAWVSRRRKNEGVGGEGVSGWLVG